jgi:hypothetical protein
MAGVFRVPQGKWSEPDGTPTMAFFRFITNLFNSSPGAAVANGSIMANISGGAAAAAPNTLSAILDFGIGSVRGEIAYRGSSAWGVLALGTTGKALVSNGTDLTYALVASLAATVTLAAPGVITTVSGDLKLDSATHTLQLGTNMTAAVTPASFSATKILAIKDGTGTTFYVPAAAAAW